MFKNLSQRRTLRLGKSHRRRHGRRLEGLEERRLLAGDFHNAANPADVNASGHISLIDTIAIVNDLRTFGVPHDLAMSPPVGLLQYLDVVPNEQVDIADLLATVQPQRDGLGTPSPALEAMLDDPGAEGETANPRINGQITEGLTPGSRIVGRIGERDWFPVAVDDQGEFSFIAPLPLDGTADGPHTLRLVVQNYGGPSASAEVPFVLRTIVPGITSISPADGEERVNVTRETIVRFGGSVDPATVTTDSFYVIANSQRVPGRVVVSSTQKFATYFYDDPLPPSTEVRAVVDGDQIMLQDGRNLDADGDRQPGGVKQIDFRTLPLTRIPGTNVWGFLKDAYTNEPIVGATIRVDGFPEANAVTDANGRYDLFDMPAPSFFVHIDGTTATSAPAGFIYPNVGKPFPSVPGQTIQMNMAGVPMDIFLPPMAMDDVTPLSATEPTEVGFGSAGLTQLETMFPNIDPSVWERTHVMIAPGGATDDHGNAATQAAVIPVPPDRLPGPLPPNLSPELVISIQPIGATNFDVPAPVTFPNLEGLAPGEQTFIFSFNHDSGQWEPAGTGTVTGDGLMIVSDPGAGIRAPGWHFPAPPVTDDEVDIDEDEECLECSDRDEDGIPDVPDPDDDNDGEGDEEEDDEEFEYEITVSIGGQFSITPVLEYSAGLQLPGSVFDQNFPQPFAWTDEVRLDPTPVDFGISFSFRVGEFFADLIEPDVYRLFNVSATAAIDAGVGLEGRFDITGFDPEIELQDMVFRPGNIELQLTFQISQTPLCALPFDIGETICQPHSPPAINLFGPPSIPLPDLEFPIPVMPVIDFTDQFSLGLSASAGLAVTFSPTLTVSKQQVPVAEGEPNGSGDPSGEENDPPSVSLHASVTSAPAIYYLYETANGVQIRGQTNETQPINAFLPPQTPYTLYVYAPRLNRTAVISGVTGPSGARSRQETTLTQIGGFDRDGDGLPDLGEHALGTSLTLIDSDGDGINDFAELQQGLNPLDNLGFPTGGIATVSLLGAAEKVAVQDDLIYVATGSHGLAVIDGAQFDNPIVLGQLDLPGTATDVSVDANLQIAAVATGQGLALVDVSDPMMPTLLRNVAVGATRVEVADGLAYATEGRFGRAIDLATGEIVQTIFFPGSSGEVTDLARDGDKLYAYLSGPDVFAIVDISREGAASVVGQLPVGIASSDVGVFVGGGVAWLAGSGLRTIDIADPQNPTLIDSGDSFFSARRIALNGSGRGLVTPDGGATLAMYDTQDPTNTANFLTQFTLSATARDVAISRGLAYIAAGSQLSVVNYLSFDNQGQPPTVALESLAEDFDPDTPGMQVLEGSTIQVRAAVADDVQVRHVELLVNGVAAARDVSFPFDFFVPLPALASGASTVSLQLRGIDTGGNSALSQMLELELTPDVFAPEIESLDPADGAQRFVGQRNARVRFSEPIAAASVVPQNFQIISAGASGAFDDGDDVVLDVALQLRDADRLVQMTTTPLEAGLYRIRLQEAGITDRSGNALGAGTTVAEFNVVEFEGSAELLPFGTDIFINQDDVSVEISPMPFAFEFFGEVVNGPMYVTSNGVVEFERNTLGGTYSNVGLPEGNRIAAYAFWDDLDPRYGGRIGLFDGEGVRAVTWENVPYYGRNGTTVTVQMAFLANGTIQIRYGEITSPPNTTATIGLARSGQTAVPSLGQIVNDPQLGITTEQGVLDANGLALLDALPENDLLVFTPDGAGGYEIAHNPFQTAAQGALTAEDLDELFAEEELFGELLLKVD